MALLRPVHTFIFRHRVSQPGDVRIIRLVLLARDVALAYRVGEFADL
jgi:hypothetical protein